MSKRYGLVERWLQRFQNSCGVFSPSVVQTKLCHQYLMPRTISTFESRHEVPGVGSTVIM